MTTRKIFIAHSLGLTEMAISYAKQQEMKPFSLRYPTENIIEVKCYVPGRDTKQKDTTPDEILATNRKAMMDSDEVHALWDLSSLGTIFDLGMAYALNKPIKIVHTKTHHWTKFIESRKGEYLFGR